MSRILVTCLVVFLTTLCAYASADWRLKKGQEVVISKYFDPNNQSLEKIVTLPESEWTVLDKGITDYDFMDQEYWRASQGAILWLKLQLPRRTENNRLWIELIPNVGLDGELAIYKDNHWRFFSPAGQQGPIKKLLPATFLTFVVDSNNAKEEDLGKRYQTAYLKLRTSQIFQFSVSVNTENEQLWSMLKDHLFNGFLFGLLVLALAYNLAIGVSAGEKMYLYYAFYVLCNAIYLMVISGYPRLIFPEWGGSGSLSNLTVLLTLFSGTLFAREFLDTANSIPRVDTLLRVLQAALFVGMAIIGFASDIVAYSYAELLGIIGPIVILLSGILSWRAGHQLALYFLVAWTVFLITAALWGWMWLGIIEPKLWVLQLFKLGTILEVILLTMVLGYRYSHLKRQTESLSEAKSRYQELSETDDLTGIYNRRGFIKEAERVISQQKKDMVWLALDVDHFKRFNDLHGHVAGDQLLTAFGDLLATKGRRENFTAKLIDTQDNKAYRHGIAGRVGGEEFVVLLINCALPRARLYADRLLRDFENLRVNNIEGDEVGTTLSIGATVVTPQDTVETVWKRADDLLYKAKEEGRNQVFIV